MGGSANPVTTAKKVSESAKKSTSSSSSSSLGARHYGQWQDNPTCKCDHKHWKCKYIRHQAVPLADHVPDIINFAAMGALSYLKHHCLKLRIQCKNCDLVFYITVEHGKEGVHLHHGFYQRETNVVQEQAIDILYARAFSAYESLHHRTYHLIEYNCMHFAYEFYRAIVERNAAAA